MYVVAVENNRYLVKIKKEDRMCYCIDIKLKYVYGYDDVEKFMKFGVYEYYDMNNLDEKLKNIFIELLKDYGI